MEIRNNIDPVLGINLEGRLPTSHQEGENSCAKHFHTTMEHDLEDGVLIGEEGKKRSKGEIEDLIIKEEVNTVAVGKQMKLRNGRDSQIVFSTLKASYTKEEIREALKELGPKKTPGEEGFPVLFYQKCWSIIGEDVTSFCLNLLNEGTDLSAINKPILY
ncbi:hypothetical protein PVK06_002611 [Gossypium arboreum]|uniref:Reverse transcriptase n=1 Tax=Gossypium arboreum TaxID=29729 RepID=A0ABR0R409_GOSAR|nr:hypothetical protein PVK06_002611 [Gossypium arboreum]